jgi:hypothetical protein
MFSQKQDQISQVRDSAAIASLLAQTREKAIGFLKCPCWALLSIETYTSHEVRGSLRN